ncbi:MAG: hypothetical protein AB7N90_14300, partial [Vicinamibacterales bacterium]
MVDSAIEARFTTLGYRLLLAEDEDGVWVASARRLDTGDPFGPPVPGDGPDEAAEMLARWLAWQQAHAGALAALQAAEGQYNRLVAESALCSGGDHAGEGRLRAAL